jgi:tetratricopeptide (TPR) repeat protein
LDRLALAYTMGAMLAASTPRDEDAPEWFRKGAELASRIPDPDSPLLRLASPVASLFGAPTLNEPVSPAVFDEAAGDPHPWVRAIARLLRGHVTVNFGGLHAQAKADFLAAVDIAGTLGERWVTAVALSALAMLEGWRGEHAAAAEHYRQASQLAAELGTIEDELQFRLFGVRELWLLGEHDRARAELLQAQRDAERLGVPEVLALAAFTAGDLARLDGEHDAARTALVRAAELAAPRHVPPQLRAVTATGLGYLSAADGDLDAARGWHAQALAAARSSADAPVIAQALVGLADLALREGRPERAAELLGASSGIRGTTDRSVQDEQMVAEAARAELGEAGYGEAYQRGQRVTLDTLPALIEVTPGA